MVWRTCVTYASIYAQVNHERVFALGDVAGPAAVQGPEAAGAAFPNTAQVRCCAVKRVTLCFGTHDGHMLLPGDPQLCGAAHSRLGDVNDMC